VLPGPEKAWQTLKSSWYWQTKHGELGPQPAFPFLGMYSTYHLLVDPLQLGDKLVMELATNPLAVSIDSIATRLTILKCTGGPPNEVNPRYQVSRTVFQSLGPKFPVLVPQPQELGDKPCLMPISAEVGPFRSPCLAPSLDRATVTKSDTTRVATDLSMVSVGRDGG